LSVDQESFAIAHPLVPAIRRRVALDRVQIRRAGIYGKRLTLQNVLACTPGGDGDLPPENAHIPAAFENIHAKFRFARGRDAEPVSRDGKLLARCEVSIKRGSPTSERHFRNTPSVRERQLRELDYGILGEPHHASMLKLDFRPPANGAQGESLLDRHVCRCWLPIRAVIRARNLNVAGHLA
jgi:hypothetical protein